ncbi:MFS transporter [Micromonospora echinospora]|uniref:MFS transporter n=1 Tax=Micromonospora echinospora TaxID=1877 RepID=UPI003410D7D8
MLNTLRKLVVDVRPLRLNAEFRRLWFGSTLSALGSRMTAFAVALQVYELTGSSAAVGAVGLAVLLPTLAVGLLGGSLADAFDRRRLVLVTSTGLAFVSLLLAAQAFLWSGNLWLIYGLTAVQSLLSAVDGPARRTFVPRLLSGDLLPAGIALQMLAFHLSLIAGPALAGLLATVGGVQLCYLVDSLTFLLALYAVFRLPPMVAQGAPSRPGIRAVLAGFGYIRRNRTVAGALLSDLSATVLAMPFAIFPAINAAHFGGSAATLGLLNAAPGLGGVLATAFSGPVGRATRKGAVLLVAGAVWGLALAGFGLTDQLWLALALLTVAGVADATSVVLRGAIVQTTTTDEFRGRITAVDFVVGAGGPHLGNFRGGVLASATSPAVSAVTGGVSSVLGIALIALCFPALRRYGTAAGPGGPDPADDDTPGAGAPRVGVDAAGGAPAAGVSGGGGAAPA